MSIHDLLRRNDKPCYSKFIISFVRSPRKLPAKYTALIRGNQIRRAGSSETRFSDRGEASGKYRL